MNKSVVYMGHSAWGVRTEKCWLFFDYQKKDAQEGGLERGLINFDQLKNRRKVFFASHFHHDHYSKSIAKVMDKQTDCQYVLGGFTARGCVSINPREEKTIEDVTVSTAGSTDSGVCFLVQNGGLTIFHSGDNADWGDEDDAPGVSYYEEIDYIANKGIKIDIAFIPVCTFSGERPQAMTRGALYAINKLQPDIVFPMHGNGREFLYGEFAEEAHAVGVNNKIVCMAQEGDVFRL